MGEARTWTPDARTMLAWQIIGLAIFVVALVGFAFLAVGGDTVEFGAADLFAGLLAALAILLVHEAIHGAAMRLFGARPRFGAKLLSRSLPVLFCTAPGHRFTRGQFACLALAPLVLITATGVAAIVWTAWGGHLVLALALNASGAIGDLWVAGLVLRAAPGTLVEDLEDGVRFHPPVARTVSPRR